MTNEAVRQVRQVYSSVAVGWGEGGRLQRDTGRGGAEGTEAPIGGKRAECLVYLLVNQPKRICRGPVLQWSGPVWADAVVE